MRIALISPVDAPVVAEGSGSIQTLVWLLSRELTAMGHDVTVFATAGSEPCGKLVATLPGGSGENGSPEDWHTAEWITLCHAVERSGEFDVIHSHNYLWGLPLEPFSRAPMVHTLHLWGRRDQAYLWSNVPGACVTAISHCQWSSYPRLVPAAVIHHGVDVSQFTFRLQPDDYVCFIGQFNDRKNPIGAIETARAAGVRILLAGHINDYYHEHVEPFVDGRTVQYVGWVEGVERDRLLGGAKALLYPLEVKEPFGLVQVEAMLCGTPVAAIGIGAVPEIVDEGITGCIAGSPEGLTDALTRAMSLDRRAVRARAEARFSAARMAREYLDVYRNLIACRAPAAVAGRAS